MTRELKRLFYLTVLGIGLLIGFQYLFSILAPFIFGIILACLIEPIVKMLESAWGWNRNTAVGTVLGTLMVIILIISSIALLTLYQEAQRLLPKIPLLVEKIVLLGQGLFKQIILYCPGIEQNLSNLSGDPESINRIFRSIIVWLMGLLPKLPKLLLAIGFGGVTAYFISRDKQKITGFITRNIPRKWQALTLQVKEEMTTAFFRFIRAEFILVTITAILTTIFFGMFQISGAVAYGLLVGILDFVPVLGPGLVYIPLAAVFLIFGDLQLGIWVLIIYCLVIIIRQFTEIKLVGDNLNIHPLLSLFLFYLGITYFGMAGIIFLPITVIILRSVQRSLMLTIAPEQLSQSVT